MKKFFLSVLAIMLPWVVLLLYDNPGAAVIALVMQITMIGWIPASGWAWRVVHAPKKQKKLSPEKE